MRKLMWLTLGFGAGCAGGVYLWEYRADLWFVLLLGMLLTAAVSLLRKKLLKRCAVLLLGALLALLWCHGYDRLYLSVPRELDREILSVTAVASDYSYETPYGIAVDAKIQLDGKTYSIKLYLNQEDGVAPGDTVSGVFRLRYTAAGGSGDPTYHRGEGMFLLAYPVRDVAVTQGKLTARYIPAWLRLQILDALEKSFPSDTEAFAKGLLLGDSSGFDYETDTALSVSGIRHIVAVSGLHVAILFSLVCFLTGRHRKLQLILGVPILILFAAMAGFTPSVVRACVMQLLMLIALQAKQEYDPPTALSFAVLVMLGINPHTITSVSFQLSVGSVAGIFLFAGKVNRRLLVLLNPGTGKNIQGKMKRWLAGSVSVTLSAMSLTTPLVAWYFGAVSLIGVLTNLLTLWVVSLLFCGVILVCGVFFVWNQAGVCLGWLLAWPMRYVLGVAKLLARLPFAAVYTRSVYIVCWLVFCYVLFAVFLACKKKPVRALCCCTALGLMLSLLLSWVEPLQGDYRLTVLDVGQGQCVLLQSEGKTYMVDCGGEDAEAVADLAAETLLSQGITRLDGLILTHYDADHVGAAEHLLTRVDVATLFLPAKTDEGGLDMRLREQTKGSVVVVSQNMRLSFGKATIDLYTSAAQSDNESSLCILFQREECGILITGDRSVDGEWALLRSASLPQVDILLAGHHGSQTSTGRQLLETVRPTTVVISVGENNGYGHPAQSLLDRLEEFGCQVRRTDREGTIIIWG